MRNFTIWTPQNFFQVIKSVRIRRKVRNTYGRDERCIQVFGEKSGQIEDIGVNADIIKIDF
jgi:hypothetical protein